VENHYESPPRYGSKSYGPITFWVELNAPGEKPEPHQVREHKRMQAMGQCVVVIDSIELVDELLGG